MAKEPAVKKKPTIDKVEYKVLSCASTSSWDVEAALNDLAIDGWRVVTAIQHGGQLILERDL